MGRYKYSGQVFWGIIIIGLFLPLIVELAVELIFDPKHFISTLLSLSPSSILMGVFNAIPFIVFAFLVRSLWHRPEHETFQLFFKHKSGVLGAGIIGIGFILLVNINVWVGAVLTLPGFSTSGLVYMFIPFYGIVAILIGYGIGYVVGRIIIFRREKKA